MKSRKARTMVMALTPIYGITLVDVFGYMIMVPLLPYVAQRYGANGVEVGALLATMAVASVVAAPVWGVLSDRLGRKPMVLFSQVVSLVGYVLLATAPSLAMLFVARGVAGIGGGGVGVTQSYIADVTDEAHRDRAYGLFGVVFGIGIVLGPVAGGFLVRFGYFAPFAVAAAIELVNIGLTLRFLPNTHRQTDQRTSVLAAARQVLELPDVRLLVARHFLFIFAVTFFFTIFALYVRRALDLGPSHASWLLAGTGVVGGIALVAVVAPLAERFGDRPVAQAGLGLSAAAYIALPFARTIPAFAGVLVVWAIGASCIEPTLSALLSERAPEDRRGATMGVNDALSNLALMLAPPLGGWIIDKSLVLVGFVPAAVVLCAFALGFVGPHRPGKRHGATERKKGLTLADSVES